MFLLVLLFMGLVPMILYTTLLWWIDHWEREPWYLIAAAFLWGAVPSIILAVVSQQFIDCLLSSDVFYGSCDPLIFGAVIVAPLTEESAKAIALLLLFLFLRQHIDSLLDGLIYGAAVGFGFAAVENIVYFFGPALYGGLEGLLEVAFFRAFIFGLNHAYFTGMTGLGFALARFRTDWVSRLAFPLLGLLLAMMLHGSHNLLAVSAMYNPAGLLRAIALHSFGIFGVIVLIITSLLVQRQWVRRYLQDEVQRGVLTPAQARTASSLLSSWTMCGMQRRFNQLCAKLAMLDHTRSRVGEQGQPECEIERLRQRVTRLSRYLCAHSPA